MLRLPAGGGCAWRTLGWGQQARGGGLPLRAAATVGRKYPWQPVGEGETAPGASARAATLQLRLLLDCRRVDAAVAAEQHHHNISKVPQQSVGIRRSFVSQQSFSKSATTPAGAAPAPPAGAQPAGAAGMVTRHPEHQDRHRGRNRPCRNDSQQRAWPCCTHRAAADVAPSPTLGRRQLHALAGIQTLEAERQHVVRQAGLGGCIPPTAWWRRAASLAWTPRANGCKGAGGRAHGLAPAPARPLPALLCCSNKMLNRGLGSAFPSRRHLASADPKTRTKRLQANWGPIGVRAGRERSSQRTFRRSLLRLLPPAIHSS